MVEFTYRRETHFYYKINMQITSVRDFIINLENQSIEIPKSKIIGVARTDRPDTWVIYVRAGFIPTVMKIQVSVRSENFSIVIHSKDGDLMLRYDLYKLDDNNTLVDFYVKIIERLGTLLSSEIPLLNQRFIKSIQTRFRNISIEQLTPERFNSLLLSATRVVREEARGVEIKEKPISQKIVPPTTVELTAQEIIKKPDETAPSKPEALMLEIKREEKVEKALPKIEEKTAVAVKQISCRECILYDDSSGYCVLLIRRIEDPFKPPCNGEGFIKRS